MTRLKHFARLGVVVWLSLTSGIPVVLAAEPAVDGDDQPPEVAAPAETGSPGDSDANGEPEVFVPTEEISEDFAVSFPVDI